MSIAPHMQVFAAYMDAAQVTCPKCARHGYVMTPRVQGSVSLGVTMTYGVKHVDGRAKDCAVAMEIPNVKRTKLS